MWPSVMVTAAHSLLLERPSVSIVAAAHVVLVGRMTLCCLSLALRKKNTGSAVISGPFFYETFYVFWRPDGYLLFVCFFVFFGGTVGFLPLRHAGRCWFWMSALLEDQRAVSVSRVKDFPHFQAAAGQEAWSSLPASLLHVHCVYTHCGLQAV